MAGTWLPLFPLSVVLFPGSSISLHIYEERYKTLIHECLGSGREFGVNLVQASGLAAVGCAARVTTVLRRYDDGRMDIVVRGGERYRITGRERGGSPYLVSQIEWLEDPEETPDPALVRETLRLYALLRAIASGAQDVPPDPETSVKGLSFRIAQKAGLGLGERQRLLETAGENQRLGILNTHLADLVPRLKSLEDIERVARNDGYL